MGNWTTCGTFGRTWTLWPKIMKRIVKMCKQLEDLNNHKWRWNLKLRKQSVISSGRPTSKVRRDLNRVIGTWNRYDRVLLLVLILLVLVGGRLVLHLLIASGPLRGLCNILVCRLVLVVWLLLLWRLRRSEWNLNVGSRYRQRSLSTSTNFKSVLCANRVYVCLFVNGWFVSLKNEGIKIISDASPEHQ